MMKRFVVLWLVVVAVTATLIGTAQARRLKVYSFPKQVAPGQLATIIFENPSPDEVKSMSKCTAEKLIAWVKSDVPILRFEQNGKQIWTSLGSYQSIGDSCVATFMLPVSLAAGPANFFLVNDRDASVPYSLTVTTNPEVKLKGVQGNAITPLGQFRIIGEGFVPSDVLSSQQAINELEANVGYSKLSKPEQWQALNHRMLKDWEKLTDGDFLYLEQNGKKWQTFVQQCGVAADGLALDFSAPPDIKPGPLTMVMKLRMGGKEVAASTPITVMVQ